MTRNSTTLENLSWDLRYAYRRLRKTPVFSIAAVVTLALAIGANTAIFTVVHAVLLKPLDYPDSARLVLASGGATPTRFAETKQAAANIADFGAYTREENVIVAGAREPEVLRAVHVSADFLRILKVSPIRGRDFREEEDAAGADPVAMISAELWERRFAADPQIAGKSLDIGSVPYQIIGVLPARFQFPAPGLDIWMAAPSNIPTTQPKSRALSPFLTIFGRLRPGASSKRAEAQMKVVRRQYATAHPEMLDAKPNKPVELTPLKQDLVANVQSMLWTLLGAVGFVLLIACANLATLMLIRARGQETEFAVRLALGAGRGRLMGQLLTESVLISFAGGVLGTALAAGCVRAIRGMTAFELPRLGEIQIDWAVLAFTTLLSVLTAVLFGLMPAVGASRPDLVEALRATGESPSRRGRSRVSALLSGRALLSMAQIALSVVLLIGAGLLIRSVASLRAVDVGFNANGLFTADIDLPPLHYDSDLKVARFFDELCERLTALPGVRSAAAAMALPMMAYPGIPVQDAAKPKLKLNERLIAKFFPVTPDYFRTLGIPLKRGRPFSQHDTLDNQRVAIIDESLARHFWPKYPNGIDPVGQHLFVGGVNPKPAEIVGIVGNVKQDLDDRENWKETVYVSLLQTPIPNAVLAVRSGGNPLELTQAIQHEIRAIDPQQPIGTPETMQDRMEAQVGQRRLVLDLLISFAALAALLAILGIYAAVAYSVKQRTRELGIRRALGAQRRDILQLVLAQGLVLAAVGIASGLAGAYALTRLLGDFLFDVSATDPLVFFAVALLFLAAAMAATYLPAWSAANVDPVSAIRERGNT